MIKAFIFDFDGVLVRTEDTSPHFAWDKRLGLAPGSVERAIRHSDLWIQAQLGRVTPRAYWTGVAEMLYMRRDDIAELRRDCLGGDRLNYRAIDLLRDLHERGCTVVLLANDSIELEARLTELGIDALFDHILISAQIGVMKPDVTAFRVALQTVGAAPGEVVLIDDSLTNIRAAQALGMHAVLVRPETDVRAELQPYLDDPSP